MMITKACVPPLVSCILPTKNRARYIGLAIQSYLSQTYPYRELVIVDNGNDSTAELIPEHSNIAYHHVGGYRTTGEMRNLCVEASQGSIICHFDSDDWSASDRVERQVQQLGEAMVLVGFYSMTFYDERTQQAYLWKTNTTQVALGMSFCYRRDWWTTHPFKPLLIGEDYWFFQTVLREAESRVCTQQAGQAMVALVHDHQTSLKNLKPPRYTLLPNTAVPKEFLRDLASSVPPRDK